MARSRDGDRHSDRSCAPELSGRIDDVTAARARRLAEDPSATAEDVRRFRAEYAAERARRKAACAQLDRDLLALMEESLESLRRSDRP